MPARFHPGKRGLCRVMAGMSGVRRLWIKMDSGLKDATVLIGLYRCA